jgi:MoaA/NifB/PqqE/SkfB family radical SAM enzyme
MKTEINDRGELESLPSRVIFEITQRCNYSCPDCISGGNLNELSAQDIITIGKKIVKSNVPSISWTGGEPYLKKNFLEIVKEVLDYGQSTIHTVNTNGSLIDQAVASESAKIFSLARVTIYGTKDSFYGNTGGVKRFSFETSIKAIDYFLEGGLPVQVNIPIFDRSDILSILELLNTRYGANIEEAVLIPRIIGNGMSGEKLVFQGDENVSLSDFDDYHFSVRVFKWQPGKHMVIKANGLAYAHPVPGNKDYALMIGSAKEESILDLWQKFPQEFIGHHRELTPDLSHLKKNK